jgi:hypothetical protein
MPQSTRQISVKILGKLARNTHHSVWSQWTRTRDELENANHRLWLEGERERSVRVADGDLDGSSLSDRVGTIVATDVLAQVLLVDFIGLRTQLYLTVPRTG